MRPSHRPFHYRLPSSVPLYVLIFLSVSGLSFSTYLDADVLFSAGGGIGLTQVSLPKQTSF